MAQIATLNQPYTVGDLLDGIPGIPVGDLIDVAVLGEPDGVVSTVTNRFPTPPSALAFLTDPFFELDTSLALDKVNANGVIAGALTPESSYLEPNIGQIWPRTG